MELFSSPDSSDTASKAQTPTLTRRPRASFGEYSLDTAEGSALHPSEDKIFPVLVDDTAACLQLTATGVAWSPPGCDKSALHAVPFAEVLGVERLGAPAELHGCGGSRAKLHALALYTFRRDELSPCSWHPWRITVAAARQETISELAQTIGSKVSAAGYAHRPQQLLVIINPNAGSGNAHTLYRTVALPVFAQAGIEVAVRETRRAGHAEQMMLGLGAGAGIVADGVVVVGGDGVFHEVLNGLLAARASADPARAARLAALRLAHLPCGSTDALACSLHGTRSVFTAAVHVALGDSTPLDVLRVDVGGQRRFACCIATCGFMSSVVQASERHRWLGQLRYDVVGAAVLAANKSYRCRVRYVGGAQALPKTDAACSAECGVCRSASLHGAHAGANRDIEAGSGRTLLSSPAGLEGAAVSLRLGGSWTALEGDFMSIMLIVQPCVTEKTPYGMARHGHLANGRMTLVLVRRCSPLQYLTFLSTMSSSGLVPGQLPYVDVVEDAVACTVESKEADGTPLLFNLDGELTPGGDMAAEVHEGLVQVFARGVERRGDVGQRAFVPLPL